MKKLKPSIPKAQTIYAKVQTLCIISTNYLYHKYKPFVLLVRDYPNNRKGLFEQPQGIILINVRDYQYENYDDIDEIE